MSEELRPDWSLNTGPLLSSARVSIGGINSGGFFSCRLPSKSVREKSNSSLITKGS